MKRTLMLTTALAGLAAAGNAFSDIPAFPNAEGFGAASKGGRGGKVLFVTNLDDSGPGSLRAACETEGPRTVMFRTGGLIELKKAIRIRHPFITIAGQTASGDGACLKNFGLFLEDTHDVILRYLRLRPGSDSGKEVDGLTQLGSERLIIDHCSISWSVDECLDLTGNAETGHTKTRDCTVQWCIISEPLRNSVHHKQAHGYAFLMNFATEATVSVHHNLFAHMMTRAPRPGAADEAPGMLFDFRNNVLYNWSAQAGYSGTGTVRMNYLNNYIRPGPSTLETSTRKVFSPEKGTKMHLAGNIYHGSDAFTADNRLFIKLPDLPPPPPTPSPGEGKTAASSPPAPKPKLSPEEKARLIAEDKRRLEEDHKQRVSAYLVEQPFATAAVRTQSAQEAFASVLQSAGATSPRRDAIDRRIVTEAETGAGRLIDHPIEVGGWPDYASEVAPADKDNDGMTDAWEKQHGLDPTKDDHAADADGDGYENLEEFLNGTEP